jgi:hypothetical protein
MTIHIIGTTGVINGHHKKNSTNLFNLVGKNTGNVLFQYAVNSIIKGKKQFYNWDFDPHKINELGGVIVIPCANFAHPDFDLTTWADKLDQTHLPVISMGLGAQIFNDPRELRLKQGTLRFLKILSERAQKIWVRGFKSAEALAQFGILNTIPLGCPSNFINADVNLGKKIAEKTKLPINAVTFCPSFYNRNSPIELEVFSQYKSRIRSIIIQEPLSLIRNIRDKIKLEKNASVDEEYGLLEVLEKDDLILYDRLKTVFFSADAWIEYLKPSDLCIGARIHGILAAWQAGVPSIVNAFDERIGELAEIMCLPFHRFSESQAKFNEEKALLTIAECALRYDDNRIVLAARAADFLRVNQLEASDDFSKLSNINTVKDKSDSSLYMEILDKKENNNILEAGILERYSEKSVHGWAKGIFDKKTLLLNLFINDEFICSRENNIYRNDLEQTVGFEFYLPEWVAKAGAIKIDVRCKNSQKSISNSPLIINLHPNESKKVLIGTEGYLFLTNDTNKTIDQISGRELLSDQDVVGWQEFFEKLSSLPTSAQVCFVVAPFKEVVYQKYLPDEIIISEDRNIKTVKRLAESCSTHRDFYFCYPIEKIQMLHDSFPKGDTHWNFSAAFLCLTECLTHFFGQDTVTNFYKDFFNGFQEAYSHADLLSKLGGICIERKQVPNFSGSVASKFTAGIHSQNSGKEVFYQFSAAPVNRRCLVLHDSFGEWFSPLLSRFFSTVVFKWASDLSAEDMIIYDFFIFERAERFLTKPLTVSL